PAHHAPVVVEQSVVVLACADVVALLGDEVPCEQELAVVVKGSLSDPNSITVHLHPSDHATRRPARGAHTMLSHATEPSRGRTSCGPAWPGRRPCGSVRASPPAPL